MTMAKLTGKIGSWDLPFVHMWKDRRAEIMSTRSPVIDAKSKIATIGSCFAAEIAAAMDRLGLDGAMHPGGLFYTTRSIRQEIERIFGGWKEYADEPAWQTKAGWVHPFKDYGTAFPTKDALLAWSREQDEAAEKLFRGAKVVVITLGLIEGWMNPTTGNHFRQIPHPDVFPSLGAKFNRLTVAEMREDLERTCAAIQKHIGAKIIVTVSPVPLHATLTPHDVRVANTESKSRIRAMVSELVDDHPEIHYFHSYEMVTTAERQSDFMLEDGRHVQRHAVDYILQQFLAAFGGEGVTVPTVDTSWLSGPSKTAERPHESLADRAKALIKRGLGR
jgi:hypothetical protein